MANVRNFGAAGDGRQDDTDAIRHAVEQGDGVLEFPSGTYRIRETIEIDLQATGYRSLVGARGTSRIVMAGPGPALRLIGTHQGTADPPSVQPPVWQRERMPTISELEVVGDNPQADGIELIRTIQTTLDRILLRNLRHGVVLSERNRNFLIANSHIYDNSGIGIFFDRCNLHQAIVVGNHISYNRQAGIKSLAGDLHNLQITGNDIEYNYGDEESGAADLFFDAREGMASEVTIASNTIQARPSEQGTNLLVLGGPSTTGNSARLFAVTGNVLGSQSTNVEMHRTDRITLVGNTIYDGRTMAVRCVDCAHLVIGNNTFGWAIGPERQMTDSIFLQGCWSANISGLTLHASRYGDADAGGAITLIDCEDAAVSNCQILSPDWRGVYLGNCRRCRVDHNSIIDRRDELQMISGVEVRGGRDNLVQNNLIRARDEAVRLADGAGTALNNTTAS